MNNIEFFNAVVGAIFDQLYKHFPCEVEIDEVEIGVTVGIPDTFSDEVEDENYFWEYEIVRARNRLFMLAQPMIDGHNVSTFIYDSLCWLVAEGFIRKEESISSGPPSYVLTAKALAALNATPGSLDCTLGAKLGEAVKSASSEAGRAAISETVGQIIGAVSRGYFGSL